MAKTAFFLRVSVVPLPEQGQNTSTNLCFSYREAKLYDTLANEIQAEYLVEQQERPLKGGNIFFSLPSFEVPSVGIRWIGLEKKDSE